MSEQIGKLENTHYAVFSEPIQIAEDVSSVMRVGAVIAKEGVYTFPSGPNGSNQQCLWSRQELLKATRTARAAKITIVDHPPAKVVTCQEEIYGVIEKPFYDRDRIRVTLCYDNDVTPKEFLEKVRKAAAKEIAPLDVSMGFYYKDDVTPGVWNGQRYDMVMRNIVVDHVATGVLKGRCSVPNAGIGVASADIEKRFMPAAVQANIGVSPAVEVPAVSVPKVEVPAASVTPAPVVVAPIAPPKIEPAVVAPKPKLSTQELIERNQSLLDMKQKRSEQNRIELLRNMRRNPLNY